MTVAFYLVQTGTSSFTATSSTCRAWGWHACRGWHSISPPPLLSTEAAVTDVNSEERQVKVCSCLSFVYSQALFIVIWTVIPSFLLWKCRKASPAPHVQHRWEWHSFIMACTQLSACTPQTKLEVIQENRESIQKWFWNTHSHPRQVSQIDSQSC